MLDLSIALSSDSVAPDEGYLENYPGAASSCGEPAGPVPAMEPNPAIGRFAGRVFRVVLAIRDAEIPCGRVAEMLLQEGERLCPRVRAGAKILMRLKHKPAACAAAKNSKKRVEARSLQSAMSVGNVGELIGTS